MRAVVQRVSRANVVVGGETSGEIGQGLLVLLAVGQADTESDAHYLAEKVAGLRIFEDEKGKMNLAVAEIGGGVLVVSQFTLYGHRPIAALLCWGIPAVAGEGSSNERFS